MLILLWVKSLKCLRQKTQGININDYTFFKFKVGVCACSVYNICNYNAQSFSKCHFVKKNKKSWFEFLFFHFIQQVMKKRYEKYVVIHYHVRKNGNCLSILFEELMMPTYLILSCKRISFDMQKLFLTEISIFGKKTWCPKICSIYISVLNSCLRFRPNMIASQWVVFLTQ